MTTESFIRQAGLETVLEKIKAGVRLTAEDGLQLYRCDDILAVGSLADRVRNRLNGNRTYFIYNQHINYSNICTNLCKFCAFGKEKGSALAYQMTVDEVKKKVRDRLDEPITEIHMVGGLHPDLPFSYYLGLLRGIKEIRPEVHIQAFTCVEIAHLANLACKSVADTLELLKEAGLGSLPGGGAEVFNPRIRQLTCDKKLPGEEWLEVAKTAHRHGLRTNATMLYGHIEEYEHRVDHMRRLRELQDETKGFQAFIPLAFHPDHTAMDHFARPSGVEDLKTLAVGRVYLDNFDHIKAYWISLGAKLAQLALSYGVDDIDGTVIEEKIYHMAGSDTPEVMTVRDLRRLITDAGRTPLERDTLYREQRPAPETATAK